MPESSQSRVRRGLSIVVPVYNELDGLVPLVESIEAAMPDGTDWELLLVDDGSSDGSDVRIEELARTHLNVVGVFLGGHYGQTSAMAAGFRNAGYEVIGTLDADLQTDPADLLVLSSRLDAYDAVVGYRAERNDSWLRRVSSRIANGVRDRITGDSVKDTGCPMKVFRRGPLLQVALFEGMHRFLPTLLRMHGFQVLEVPVNHRPRVIGKSKYGVLNRLGKSLVDLAAVVWMRSRLLPRPSQIRLTREL